MFNYAKGGDSMTAYEIIMLIIAIIGLVLDIISIKNWP